MKIVQVCPYTSPARDSQGAERFLEALTRGFVELGHDVVMKLNPDSERTPAPLVGEIPKDADILHFHGWDPKTSQQEYDSYGIPYVVTMHGGGLESDPLWLKTVVGNPHIVCVSKFISDRLQCPAYVWASSAPWDFHFNAMKESYYLWMAGTDWGEGKGLFTTIRLAKKLHFRLKIAGTGKNKATINQIISLCDDKIEYVGAVNGGPKADILSKAKALFLLTQLPDACPLTVSEALLSGTPIIASDQGAMPELINDKVGFVCGNETDMVKAVVGIKKIKPQDCFIYGLEKFSYLQASEKYIQIYKNMIESGKTYR